MADPAAVSRREASGTVLQVYLLGRFQVVVGGSVVPDDAWRRRKARQLFKCLLSRPHRQLTKDETVELLWPGSEPEAAAINLRSTVHALRQTLRDPTAAEERDLVVVTREVIALRPGADLWVDADEFERALARAQRAADPSALLEQANTLYAGDYLPEDLYEDWATERREALRRAWRELQLELAERRERRGDTERALAALLSLRDADPCDERAAQELMRLLVRQGRRADALRVYQRLVQSLRDELEVGPSDQTVQLERQVASGELFDRRDPAAGRSEAPPAFVCAYPFPAPGRLVGREAELERLGLILERGRTVGQVVLLGGAVGAGKSALTGHLVEEARQAGVLCLAGGCFEQEAGLPLGPFKEALADYLLDQPPERVRALLGGVAADLARIVPELRYRLDLADGAAADAQLERPRLFAAVHACLRALAERGPLLLCLEDLHAADAVTLDLIHYLARQTRRLPLVLLGTYRPEEVAPGQPLARLRDGLARERLAEPIALPALARPASDRLVGARLDGPVDARLSEALFAATEGNPLFVEQLVLALREQGGIVRRDGVWTQAGAIEAVVPPLIRDVIGQRLDRLSARCRSTLEMVAVLGQSVPHDLLLATLDADDEAVLLADLDEALGAQLLYETGAGYTFRHALVREAVYWGLSTPRRMLLHTRAGETLERRAAEGAPSAPAELARHFLRAGHASAIRRKALVASLAAGQAAAALYAHREALAHFARALELIELDHELADPPARLEALEGRGSAERQLAMWSATIATFRRVLELSAEPIQRARAHGAIAYALNNTGDVDAALAEWALAAPELGRATDRKAALVVELQLDNQKASPWFLRGRYRDLVALGERMLATARELDQPRALYWAHSVVASGHMGQGQVEPALEHYRRALAAAERAADREQVALAHVNLGMQHYLGGLFPAGREHLERSIALLGEVASDLRAVNALQNLGRLCLAEGDRGRARALAEQVIALAVEGGDRWAASGHDLLGLVQSLEAEWEEAEASFARALAIRRRARSMSATVESLLGLGLACQRRGHWPRALALYHEALELASALDTSPHQVAALRHLGRLTLLTGDPAAPEQIERAAALAESMPGTLEFAPTRLALADLARLRGDLVATRQHVEAALAAPRSVELTVELLCALCEIDLGDDRLTDARARASEALALAQRLGAPRPLGLAHLAEGRRAAAGGDCPAGARAFQTAHGCFGLARLPYEQALTHHAFAEALATRTNQLARARVMLEDARRLYLDLGAGPATAGCQPLADALASRGA